LLGLDISGTGVRNDFANPDEKSRKADIQMIEQWLIASAKLGVPAIRLFPGHNEHEGFSRNEVFEWMAADFKTCCKLGEKYGVIIAVQNHNGFLKTADDVNHLFEMVDSKWLG
jgi:sugar phosphate isomerase/epimerase